MTSLLAPRTVAGVFRAVAIAEAVSWALLLAGMFVKWVLGTSEVGVQVFGPVHGAVFVAYVLVSLLAWRVLHWTPGTALLALAANVFYVVGYTMLLKRRTSQNIVWGGAAGCFPALIGWTAVTGSLSWVPVVLFAVVFFWTPPHFWALAIRYADDYRAANVPMLPAVVPFAHAVRQMIGHTVAMVACTLLLAPVADLGAIYSVAAVVLGAVFVVATLLLGRFPTPANSMRVFGYSITYVTLLFGAMTLDVLL